MNCQIISTQTSQIPVIDKTITMRIVVTPDELATLRHWFEHDLATRAKIAEGAEITQTILQQLLDRL